MKKLLLLVFTFSFIHSIINAQVLNGTFEAWNSTSYSEPIGWSTGNQEAISKLGIVPVTEVNGLTGSAVRMETMVIGNDTAQAYIANGDPGSATGGVPCSQQPTAIAGYYRYNLPQNDTAIILVIFKSGGNVISMDVFKIKGSGSQNTFIPFSFPLSLSSTPDTVIIAAACSNLIDNVGVEAGSWMELDGLGFTGPTVAIPGSSFDAWINESFDQTLSWSANGDVTKTNDSYQGNYAIKLTTVDYGNGNIGSGSITNGIYSNNGPATGGMPFSQTADTLVGYYKYITSSTDSANISISLTNNGNWISGYGIQLPAAANYTYFEIPINSSSAHDTMRIDVNSSSWPYTQSSAGSVLYLDNIVLKSALTLGVKNIDLSQSVFVYPNPVSDLFNIHFNEMTGVNTSINIYDVSGRLILSDKFSTPGKNFQINISALKEGIYYCNIYNGENIVKKMFAKN